MPLKKIDEPLEYTPLLRPIYLSPSRIVLKWKIPLDTASFFVVGPAIPGLRAVPDLVPIHPILPPTVHIHP